MMPVRTVKVNVEVPEGISDSTKESAVRRAHQGAVLALWEAGELSTRQAAEELGLDYQEFLAVLADNGVPVERGPLGLDAIEDAVRRLAAPRP